MDDVGEGWYQDPTAPQRLRWWDGASWTGHTTAHPDAPRSIDGTGEPSGVGEAPERPASGDERTFGNGGGARGGAGAPQQRSEAELTPVWSTPASAPPVPPPRSRPQATSGPGRGASFAALAGIAVVVVVVIAGLVGIGASERDVVMVTDELDVTVDEPGFDPEDELVVPPDRQRDSGRTLRLGGSAAGEVAADEAWIAQVELTGEVEVRIDVRGADGFDAIATLRDADGQIVARNDDRGDDGAGRIGGDPLDPLLETELAAGAYELEIVGFAAAPGSFAVRVDPSGAS